MRKCVPDPLLEVHPLSAEKENLKDGDWVWVEAPQVKGERGRFKIKVTPVIDPRVVHAAHAGGIRRNGRRNTGALNPISMWS